MKSLTRKEILFNEISEYAKNVDEFTREDIRSNIGGKSITLNDILMTMVYKKYLILRLGGQKSGKYYFKYNKEIKI